MKTRLATVADGPAIAAVYAPYVENTTYTFELEAPTVEEVCQRMTRHRRHPWLVAEDEAGILGYAYAWPFEDRGGYRFAVESSIYLRQDRVGGGIGKALYTELLTLVGAGGVHHLSGADRAAQSAERASAREARVSQGRSLPEDRLQVRSLDRRGLLAAPAVDVSRAHLGGIRVGSKQTYSEAFARYFACTEKQLLS